MPKILVCQHVPFEILGTLNPLLKSHGFRIRYVNFGRHPEKKPDISRYDGLVLLGGPMSVYQTEEYPNLITEFELVRKAIRMDIPVLGICLGAQIIARALDATVTKNNQLEIGWYKVKPTKDGLDDPLIAELGGAQKIFQWHQDTFEIPEGAVCLAETTTCKNQSFRYKNNVYGLQFHLEVNAPLIERWLTIPVHQSDLKAVAPDITTQSIREDTLKYLQQSEYLSNKLFLKFISLFGNRNKNFVLKTR